MFVCNCFGITDKDIKAAVEDHAVTTMRDLKSVFTLGSQCGSCIHLAQDIINDAINDAIVFDDSLFKEVV